MGKVVQSVARLLMKAEGAGSNPALSPITPTKIMTDTPPNEDEAWNFVSPEEFLITVDGDECSTYLEQEIKHLVGRHGFDEASLLRRCILLLKGIVTTMPADVEGLDCVRADMKQRVALPCWRALIVHLLAMPELPPEDHE